MKNILFFLFTFSILFVSCQTKFEKDFFNLTNLVRTNPKLVASLIQKSDEELLEFNPDSIENVIAILNRLPAIDSLTFDSVIYENMKYNHGKLVNNVLYATTISFGSSSSKKVDTINIKSVFHDSNFLEKYGYGEIIGRYSKGINYINGWGLPTPLASLVEFLIDKNNWIDNYKITTTQWKNGVKSAVGVKPEQSSTHKPHFDSIIGDYKKSAVRINVGEDGQLYLFQDFSN